MSSTAARPGRSRAIRLPSSMVSSAECVTNVGIASHGNNPVISHLYSLLSRHSGEEKPMRAMLALAAFVAAIPCLGQTAAELLQKGIHAQETEGNLDNAILI